MKFKNNCKHPKFLTNMEACMPRSQMQAICLDRDTVHISTEDGRGQSLDLCFNFVIQLLVVFMLPYHHHQTASLHAHGSSQVLPEDGKLEYLYNKNSFSNIKCQFQQHSVSRSLSCARYTWMVCKHMATPSPRTLQACGTSPISKPLKNSKSFFCHVLYSIMTVLNKPQWE